MSLTEQPAAYADCYLIWQKAVDTPGGIRFPRRTYNEASTMQMRMNKARSIHRDLSRRAHPPNSPVYNTSEFDSHMVQVPKVPDSDGNWWVYVRPHGNLSILDQIEPISETEPEVLDDVAAAARLEATLNPRRLEHHARVQLPNRTIHHDDADISGDLE